MKSYRLSTLYTIFVLLIISSLIFSLPALAQNPATFPADQEVIPYSGNTPLSTTTPSQSLPYPVETPTLLATWQGSANSPEAPFVAGVDDRDNTAPAIWWIYTGQTDADIASFISANNARIVDMDVNTSVNPFRYTVTYVSNTGAYGSGWWYYLNVTEADLSSALSTNQARLIVLKAYDTGSETRFFAVMVPNTGADAKAWYWYYGQTVVQISALLSSLNTRLVQVNSYETTAGKRYAVVMISNTGADAKGWWWYVGASPSDHQ